MEKGNSDIFEIVKAGEPLTVRNISLLIYGEPGSGKTSLANTASNALTLDFDKGTHRSGYRQDVMKISSWKQINDNMAQLIKTFEDYDTIVMDTVDTLLDYLGAWIIYREPRLANNKLHYYGKMKDEFSRFVSQLKTIQKDIIQVAHVKEKDEGDLKIKRPAITGGSYDRVLQTSDFVGYLFIQDNKRILDFNPTDYWVGKNSAGLGRLQVPDFNTNPNYMAGLINTMKGSINSNSVMQSKAIGLIKQHSDKINAIESIYGLNSLLPELSELQPALKKQLWHVITQKADSIGAEYNKADKMFYQRG